MNAEQRGGMALNKDFRSKTGNGSVSREGRAIATPTGELHPPHLPPSPHLSLFIPPIALLLFPSLEKKQHVPCLPCLSVVAQSSFFPSFSLIVPLSFPRYCQRESPMQKVAQFKH